MDKIESKGKSNKSLRFMFLVLAVCFGCLVYYGLNYPPDSDRERECGIVYSNTGSLDFSKYANEYSPELFINELRDVVQFNYTEIDGVYQHNYGNNYTILGAAELWDIIRNPIVNANGYWQIDLIDGDKSKVTLKSTGSVEAEIDITHTGLQLTEDRIKVNDVFRERGKKQLISLFPTTYDARYGSYIVGMGVLGNTTTRDYTYQIKVIGDYPTSYRVKLLSNYPHMATGLADYVKENEKNYNLGER